MQKKALLVALFVAAITTFSVPMAANASEAPSSTCGLSPSTVSPGATSEFSSAAGIFGSSEQVSVVVSGNNGAAAGLQSASGTLGAASESSKSVVITSTSSGSAAVQVSAPANGSGAYQITATGLTTGDVCTATLTVFTTDPSDPASSIAGGTTGSGTGTGSGLADTGSVVSTTLVWAAGGIVALGALLMVAVSVIRRRSTASRR